MGSMVFFFLFFFFFLVCTAIPEKPPEEDNRRKKIKEGRESKSRQAKTRSTILEEHTKLSCKGGH